MAGVTGIVLAGGQSARLGQDKALAEVGGHSLLERVMEVLATFAEEVLVAGGPPPQLGGSQLASAVRHVPDRLPLRGPLVGIYSALEASSTELNVVVACDMPFLKADLLQHLITLAPGYDVVAPVVSGKVQTTHGVYCRGCHKAMRAALDRGIVSPLRFLKESRTHYVPQEVIEPLDPHLLSFSSVNTRGDLERARQLAAAMARGN